MIKRLLLTFILLGSALANLPAQISSVFDDSRVSSVFITIPADSLQVLYDSVLSDHYYMTRFIFDDGTYRDTLENVGFRLRGNTSREAKKKSFKISFNTYVPGRKYQGVKKLNLNGEHNDPTMVREKLFYDLWKKAGFAERRTSFMKVFINMNYYGLYTCLEEMDKDWLTRVFNKNGGNLYKCTYPADLVYHGPGQQVYKNLENSTVTGGRVYELETNQGEDDYSNLVVLISNLNMSPNAQFASSITKILNVDIFLKALAMDVATGNWDDYGYNKNNYFLYDNPSDSLFYYVAYDTDNTFGIDWVGKDWSSRDCKNWINRSFQLPMAQKLLAIPEFYNRYRQYVEIMTNTICHPDTVFPLIDRMKQLIRPAAVADIPRTWDYGYTISDFDDSFVMAIDSHTPYGLKPFFTKRRNITLQQLYPAGTDELQPMAILIHPVPAHRSGKLQVDLAAVAGIREVSAFSSTGKEVMRFTHGGESPLNIDLSSFAPGIYLLRLTTSEGRTLTGKFVVRD